MFAKILQSIAQPKFSEVLKANPYHDASGLFSSKDSARSASHWSRFGSPGRKARILSDNAKFDKLFDRDKKALEDKGLTVRCNAENFRDATNGKVTLTEFTKTMIGRTKDLSGVTVAFSGNGNRDGIRIVARNTSVHGARVTKYERTFKPSQGDVHHDYWEIHEEDRGNGAVKKFMRDGIAMYERMGYKTVSVLANIDAGAYAWAKYGFRFATEGDRWGTMADVQRKTGYLENHPDVQKALLEGVRTGKSHPVTKELNMINKLVHTDSDYTIQHLSDLKTPHLDSLASPTVTLESGKVRKSTAVQHLLNSAGWNGIFDIGDPHAMARLKKYTGKSKKKS